jgi:hypothetical protein
MDDFKKSLAQAIVGIFGSMIFYATLASAKQNNLIPPHYVYLHSLNLQDHWL